MVLSDKIIFSCAQEDKLVGEEQSLICDSLGLHTTLIATWKFPSLY